MTHCKLTACGNRFSSKWSLNDFLVAAFGDDHVRGKRIQQRNSAALALGMSSSTLSYMRTVAFGAVLARQSSLLARIYLMCKSCRPLVACLREAWDETAQLVTVNNDKGSWQLMVLKHTLLLIWQSSNGPSMVRIPVVA